MRATRYRNAGTIECLLGGDQSFYFMEMNTRLQVEHPVSEEVTGIDLVRTQLRLAMGEPLPAQGIAPTHGHAIEFRINAEDPSRGFMPSPGPLRRFRPPLGRGVRVDTHAYEGYTVPPTYDSLVAKLIVSDDTRALALGRAAQALAGVRGRGHLDDAAAVPRDGRRASRRSASGVYTTAYLEEAAGRLSSLSA